MASPASRPEIHGMTEDGRVFSVRLTPGESFVRFIKQAAATSQPTDESLIMTLSIVGLDHLPVGVALAQVEQAMSSAGVLRRPGQISGVYVERMPDWVEQSLGFPSLILTVWKERQES